MNNKKITITPGFLSCLAIVFIILKLCGVITWSWLWVLAPLWIPISVALLIVLILFIIYTIKGY